MGTLGRDDSWCLMEGVVYEGRQGQERQGLGRSEDVPDVQCQQCRRLSVRNCLNFVNFELKMIAVEVRKGIPHSHSPKTPHNI